MITSIVLYYHSSSGTPPEAIIIGFVIIVVVIVFSYYFSKKNIIKRHLAKYNETPIQSFQHGEKGKTRGEVVYAGKTLVAPLSKRRCSYYYLHVQQHHSGKNGGHWSTLFEEEDAGDLVIHDGNAYAVVDTEIVKTYIVQDRQFNSGTFHTADSNMEELLRSRGYSPNNFIGFSKRIRYMEGVLERGEIIAVSGTGNWKTSKPPQLKIPVNRFLHITADNGEEVYLSDDPDITGEHDGSTY